MSHVVGSFVAAWNKPTPYSREDIWPMSPSGSLYQAVTAGAKQSAAKVLSRSCAMISSNNLSSRCNS